MLGEVQPWFSGWWPSIDHFRKEMDSLFDRFFGEAAAPTGSLAMWPAGASFFKDGNWIIRVDLPGVDAKDIDVSVAGDTLTIRASREWHSNRQGQDHESRQVRQARFERSFNLPAGVKSDEVRASYRNGVLELRMPAGPEVEGRRIPVETGMAEVKPIEHKAQ